MAFGSFSVTSIRELPVVCWLVHWCSLFQPDTDGTRVSKCGQLSQQTRRLDPMLFQCWSSAVGGGPILKQHLVKSSRLLGSTQVSVYTHPSPTIIFSPADHGTFSKTAGQSQAYYNTWNWERGTYDVIHLQILTCEVAVSTVGSVADWLQQWAVISPTDNQSNAGREMDTGEICGIVVTTPSGGHPSAMRGVLIVHVTSRGSAGINVHSSIVQYIYICHRGARTQISNPVSGGQCHLIHLTILRGFSWPSLAYMCTGGLKLHSFIFPVNPRRWPNA